MKKRVYEISSAYRQSHLCNSDEAVGATDLRLTGIRKDRITMKVGYLRGVGLAAGVLLVALGTASADEWFVLGEPIKSMDPSTEIKAEAGSFGRRTSRRRRSRPRALTWRSRRSSSAGRVVRTTPSRMSES